MPTSKILFTMPLIAASLTFSAAAKPEYANNPPGHAYAYGRARSTSAPIAGVGLIALAPAAALLYWFLRRYHRDQD